MTHEDRLDAHADRITRLETWRIDIEDERLTSREQRTNLLWRVGVLERLVWSALGLVISCVGLQIMQMLGFVGGKTP